MSSLLQEKQNLLYLPMHKLLLDEPTCWGSTFNTVDHFCEQQQAICAALTKNKNNWHLKPTDGGNSTMGTVQQVLALLSIFTDALSGEKYTTHTWVIPIMWTIKIHLQDTDTDSVFAHNMKSEIKKYLEMR